MQKYSSPDPVAGFLHRASLDLGWDAGTCFTHVSVHEVPRCWWRTRQGSMHVVDWPCASACDALSCHHCAQMHPVAATTR